MPEDVSNCEKDTEKKTTQRRRTMGNKKLSAASVRDGVEYRTASKLSMILGVATNGGGMCFYLLMMYASYIANAGDGIAVAVAGIIITGTRIFDGIT